MKNGERRHFYQQSQIKFNNSLNTLNENNNMISSIESILFNKHLNKNKNYSCDNILSSNNYSFPRHVRKTPPHSDTFNANPFVEEIPTFSFENDMNINYYRNKINKSSRLIEKNYNTYMDYIRKNNNVNKNHDNLLSPFILYNQKIKAINNNKITNNIIDNNNLNNYRNLINLKNYNNNINNRKNNNYYNNNLTKSCKEIHSNGLKNEISNPEKYYKKLDINFYKYRQELKKCDDYNYGMILRHKQKLAGEPDINPYNYIIDSYKNGETSLPRNTILNPKEFCGY